MYLTNFTRARINDDKNFVDIQSCGGHISYGVVLTAYDFASDVVEIRRKGKETAMFALTFDDIEIPEYWKDAEVVFTTRKSNAQS